VANDARQRTLDRGRGLTSTEGIRAMDGPTREQELPRRLPGDGWITGRGDRRLRGYTQLSFISLERLTSTRDKRLYRTGHLVNRRHPPIEGLATRRLRSLRLRRPEELGYKQRKQAIGPTQLTLPRTLYPTIFIPYLVFHCDYQCYACFIHTKLWR
jgi:hypothetical protein